MKISRKAFSLKMWMMLSISLVLGSACFGSNFRKPSPGPISILDAIAQSHTIMYVEAHPDDETSIAALLARAAGAGKKVYVVCFTGGENEPMKVGVPKGEAMAKARKRWLRESAVILGVDPIQLSYVNGPLSLTQLGQGVIRYWARHAAVDQVLAQWRKSDRDPYEDMVRLIRQKRPDLILSWEITQGWTGNVEHRAVSWLVQTAFLDAARPTVFAHQIKAGLSAWQPKWFFSVVRGRGDVFGPNPAETVSCNAPARNGETACQAKTKDLIAYRKHTLPSLSPRKKKAMFRAALKYVRSHPEHVQLTLEVSSALDP